MWPIIAAAAGALGVGYLLFSKNAKADPIQFTPSAPRPKAKTSPVSKIPVPTPPAIPIIEKNAPSPTPGLSTVDVHDPASGAVHVSTQPNGTEIFKKPDGGIVVALPTVDVTAGQGPVGQAQVVTKTDPLSMRSKPSTDGAIVTKIPRGAIVAVNGPTVPGKGSTKGWAPVTYGTFTGFASADYLEMGS